MRTATPSRAPGAHPVGVGVGGSTYDTYRPAYHYGWESYGRYRGRSFDEVEPGLSRNWDSNKDKLSGNRAREATRDAWQRLDTRDDAGERGSTHRR